MDERVGPRNLRSLKWIGIVAPVVFLVTLEAVHFAILDPAFGAEAANLFASGLATAAAVGFGLVLFVHIESAQRETVRQNRELGIVNAVSLAIQGELEIDQVMQAGLDAIVRETRPDRASIHLPATAGRDDRSIRFTAPDRLHSDGLSAPQQTVEIPLAIGATSMGHLRLTVPVDGSVRLPSAEALRTVGNQVGAAIQIGQLVADLQRRKTEGHSLYQALLQIGNQAPLAEIIATIVHGACDRLAADAGRMCLTEAIVGDLTGQGDVSGAVSAAVACICPEEERLLEAGTDVHRCRTQTHGAFDQVLEASIWSPGERFGELWVAREHGVPFTERDRGYLMTLAGLATIAISAARLRERERQGATLAERDRIARELHDSLAQVLGSTHLRLRGLLARPEVAAQERTVAELTDLAEISEEAYRDVREAILGLREASRRRGLLDGLAAYLEKYGHQSGVKAVLETTVQGEPSLTTDGELQVIRVIQEALTNVRKHARASTARIRIAGGQPGGTLTIVIEDDGRGFDPGQTKISRDGGFGVQTMRERIELVGGTLRVDSAPGRGTKVIAMLPTAPLVAGPAHRRPSPSA